MTGGRHKCRVMARSATVVLAVVLMPGCGGDDETTPTPVPSVPTTVSATLTGAAAGSGASAGTGEAVVTLNSNSGRACWTLTVDDVDKPLSAHVHSGRPGETGPVVIPLGDKFAAKGCVLVPPRSLRAVLANPSNYYVSVFTAKHVNGAIRGQLRASR